VHDPAAEILIVEREMVRGIFFYLMTPSQLHGLYRVTMTWEETGRKRQRRT